MRLRSIILASLVAGLASISARAQPIQGVYIGAGAGLRFPLEIKNTPLTPSIKGDFDLSEALGIDSQVSVGYALGNGWRFELEGTYGRSSVKQTSGTSFPAASSGSVRNLGLMANVLFDLDVRSPYVYPYLGVGAGYQSTNLSGYTLAATGKPLTFSASGQAGAAAGQAIAGVSFPIPNMPGLSLTVDYRFMDILGGDTFNGTTTTPAGAVSSRTKFHNQYNETVMFGVRYAFNTPPPPVAAAAAVDPRPIARAENTYMVTFGANDATLSGRARQVVREAAETSSTRRTTRIALADAAGKPDQNLSGQRAKAVLLALIGDGVPKDAIAVMTPDGTAGPRSGSGRIEILAE